MTVSETKTPGWMRAVQIGLGIIALVLSAYVLAFPAMTFVTIVYVLGIVLLIVGMRGSSVAYLNAVPENPVGLA